MQEIRMHKQAPGGENKASMKGEAKTHRQAGSGTIRAEEHIGTSKHHAGNMGDGIRFKVHNHPDLSVMHTPEERE
jgi:hypothetical protein